MFPGTILLAASLAAFQKQPPPPVNPHASERVLLQDGSMVRGVITGIQPGSRGGVEMLVRREWAEKNLRAWYGRWDRALASGTKAAAKQRLERLRAWRRDRSAKVPADDRILAWIDREVRRLEDPARAAAPSALMPVTLPKADVRSFSRQTPANTRLLVLGWVCKIPDAETRKVDDLKDLVEARGFAPDGENVPSIAGLLPLVPEPEATWLARRAATEVTVDEGLRFVRYHEMVVPDTAAGAGAGQALGAADLSSALGSLAKLLDLDPGQGRDDPLVAVFRKIGDGGRVGAVVTRLEVPPDLSQANVEITLWVRVAAERWIPFAIKSTSMRPEDVAAGEGDRIADDPQVKRAFSLVESLGLGQVSPQLKDRALRMGAATEKALGTARGEMARALSDLMLPVLDPPGPADDRPADRAPADRPAAPGNRAPAPSGRPAGRAAGAR
ncbi:hypothetical protein OJF2_12550 [Aquisphaera giovannonii]|uniref:Uncharacterized protein n=1 Tax=Aquisphaera giovannonii TaxID=406548 RepID=A0A5B9VXG2_9BACT|nr:hypothetical protein OJF2_12550 [Aquisphaera giovannonii]